MQSSNLVFHIGLHKTGTSFLQSHVFPRFGGINYLRWRNLEYFQRLDASERYLISCEGLSGFTFATGGDRRQAIDVLGSMFPDASIVVVFRPHGAFVAALYSQYLRYGGTLPFERFFSPTQAARNIEAGPIIDADSVSYSPVIKALEDSFARPPLVVVMEDLFRSPEAFLQAFCEYAQCEPGEAEQGFKRKPKNRGLKHWQGGLLRGINGVFNARVTLDGRGRPFRTLARYGLDPSTIMIKRLAFVPSGPLVPLDVQREISERFAEDWSFVEQYARSQRWRNEAQGSLTRQDNAVTLSL